MFSQQKQLFSSDIKLNSIQFVTNNLDDITIENSKTEKLEIILENDNSFPIRIVTNKRNETIVFSFQKEETSGLESKVFRKYITKRLDRARIVVKVPKGKEISVFGQVVGVVSKSYVGDLSIYIDKGNVKLEEVKGNVSVNLFLGNIYAEINETNLTLKTVHGIIEIDEKNKETNLIESSVTNKFNLSVKSIHANIYLTKK